MPFSGRFVVTCGCGDLDAAPVPTIMQSVSRLGNGTLGLKIDLMVLNAPSKPSQISVLRGR